MKRASGAFAAWRVFDTSILCFMDDFAFTPAGRSGQNT